MIRDVPAPMALAAAVTMLLMGCTDEEPARTRAQSAPPPAQAAGPSIPLEPRYEAKLAEGIDLARPGFPSFVREVHGLSGHESWGRWTDANLAPSARIRFQSPLPTRFTLELRATGLGPNAQEPVKVRVGSVEKTLVLGDPPKPVYRLAFEGTNGADTIEIVPPRPILPGAVTPGNPDTRRLGLGLSSIRILE